MLGQPQYAEALRLENGMIERHVTEAFSHLDAATHSVEVRKLLHALFVQRAAELAAARFPDNDALRDVVDGILVALADDGIADTSLEQDESADSIC